MVTFHVSLSCFIGDIFVFKHHKIKIRHLKKERNICRILLYFLKKISSVNQLSIFKIYLVMRPNYRVDKTAKSSSNLINNNNELIHGIQGGPHLWSSCRRVKNFRSNLFKNRQTSQINHITSLVEVIMSNLTVLQFNGFLYLS